MSTNRFREDRGFVDPKNLPKGPNGRPLCRFCSKETNPPRRTFCSDDCVNNFKMQTSANYIRKRVEDRDHGKCKECGLDTHALKQVLYQVRAQRGFGAYQALLFEYKQKYNYDFALNKHYWEADHIQAVCLGGGEATIENYQTLCVPCHRKKTRWDLKKLRHKRQRG